MSRERCDWECECKRCCREVEEKQYFPDLDVEVDWLMRRAETRERENLRRQAMMNAARRAGGQPTLVRRLFQDEWDELTRF